MQDRSDTHQEDLSSLIQYLHQKESVDLILPEDTRYPEARQVYNRMHDVYPGAIVRSLDPDVLRKVIVTAREANFPLAIRGGGHHIAGFGTCDRGIVIDFSPFKGIEIDIERQIVAIEPGVLLADVDRVLNEAGFVLPTGTVSQTGLAGLTLGGGIGWLTGQFGLTCDQLCGADVLLADGRLVRAEDPEHRSLLWALRGGGGNFGLVLKFRYNIHPLPRTICGMGLITWEHALEVGNRLLDYLQQDCPPELTIAPIFIKDEDATPYFRIDFCCTAASLDVIQPLLNLSPHVTWSNVGDWSFTDWQRATDTAFLPPMRGYWKACYLEAMSEVTLRHLHSSFTKSPSRRSAILIEHLHGAFRHYTQETSAFPLRQCQFGILFSARWEQPQDDKSHIDWVRESFRRIDPDEQSKTYLNYTQMDDKRAVDTLLSATARKLEQVKKTYDPYNVFRRNHNVIPSH